MKKCVLSIFHVFLTDWSWYGLPVAEKHSLEQINPTFGKIQCVRFYSDEVKRMPFQECFEYFENFSVNKKLHSMQFFLQKNHTICFDIKSSMNRIAKVGNLNKTQTTNERKLIQTH